jgi:hypothetical protein
MLPRLILLILEFRVSDIMPARVKQADDGM